MSWTKPQQAAQWQSEFGLRVRDLRVSKGLSQMQLALAADLDPTYLSGVEQGRRNIGLVNIRVLAEALGVEPAVLFKQQPPP